MPNPPRSRLPWLAVIAYGSGNIACCILGYGIAGLANYVFNIGLGVDPFLVGLALSLPRAVDLVTDPLVGYISDLYQARFSRQAFIAAGSLAGAGLFSMIWLFPPGLSVNGYFAWLLGFSCVTFVALSFVQVPLQALGFELSQEPEDRNRLMAFHLSLGSAAAVAIGWSFAATQLPVFSTSLVGARWVGAALALIVAAFGLFSAKFAKAPPDQRAAREPSAELAAGNLGNLMASISRVFRSRPFLIVAGTVLSMCLGVFSTSSINPYIAIYYVSKGNLKAGAILVGYSLMFYQLLSVVLGPVVSWLALRFGRKPTLVTFLSLAFVGNLAKWLCYTPSVPWLFIIPSLTSAAAFATVWTIAPALVADVCDAEEQATGNYNGGMFAAFYGWTIKAGGTVAFTLSGYLLNLTGFDAALKTPQPELVLNRMRLIDFSLTAFSAGLAVYFILQLNAPKGTPGAVPLASVPEAT